MRQQPVPVRMLAPLVVCLLAASGCGSGVDADRAPTTATPQDFCLTYVKQATGIQEKLRASLVAGDRELPDGEEFATVFHDWAAEMVEVGTPSDIGPEAREGFEAVVDSAATVGADELEVDELLALDPEAAVDELSSEEFGAARAIDTYVQDTCTGIYRERGLM